MLGSGMTADKLPRRRHGLTQASQMALPHQEQQILKADNPK
jgi:hypothetical protein